MNILYIKRYRFNLILELSDFLSSYVDYEFSAFLWEVGFH